MSQHSGSSNGGKQDKPAKFMRHVAKLFQPAGAKKDAQASVRPHFNPEEHISEKREWMRRYLAGQNGGLPSQSERLFEHFAIVGLPPTLNVRAVTADIKTFQKVSRAGGAGMEVTPDTPRDGQRQYGLKGPALPAEVLHSFPGPLPRDLGESLPAFCLPHGVRPELLERTPSMSALNEVIYSQPYQTHDDHSFVFLMKVTDPGSTTPRTLYGVCCLQRELVHRPPGLARGAFPGCTAPLSRYLVAAPRCYVLLTHYPFFALHFRVLLTLLGLERLDRMTVFSEEVAALGLPSPMPSRLPTAERSASDGAITTVSSSCEESSVQGDGRRGRSTGQASGGSGPGQQREGGGLEEEVCSPLKEQQHQPGSPSPSSQQQQQQPEEEQQQEAQEQHVQQEQELQQQEEPEEAAAAVVEREAEEPGHEPGGADEASVGGATPPAEPAAEGGDEMPLGSQVHTPLDQLLATTPFFTPGHTIVAPTPASQAGAAASAQPEAAAAESSGGGEEAGEQPPARRALAASLAEAAGGSSLEGELPQASPSAALPPLPPGTSPAAAARGAADGGAREQQLLPGRPSSRASDGRSQAFSSAEEGTSDADSFVTAASNSMQTPGGGAGGAGTRTPPRHARSISGTSLGGFGGPGGEGESPLNSPRPTQHRLATAGPGSPPKAAAAASTVEVRVTMDSQPACPDSPQSHRGLMTRNDTPPRGDLISSSPLLKTSSSRRGRESAGSGSTSPSRGGGGSPLAGPRPQQAQQQVVRVTAAGLDLSRPLDSTDLLRIYHGSVVPQPGQVYEFQPDPGLQSISFERPDAGDALAGLGLRASAAALPDVDAAQNLGGWAVAALCRCLSLENVLLYLTTALLERQVVVFCPNIGLLSGVVLSLVPLLLPFSWQCLMLPVLPAMPSKLEIIEAPVPFVLGVQYKTAEVRGRCGGLVRVNVYKDRVKNAGALPQLPSHAALADALAGTYAELRRLGQTRSAATRPVHQVTDAQAALAEGFLSTVQGYLRGLMADLRAYTITEVLPSQERTSVLLKDSFVESFPPRDRPFMRQFVETQLFSVYCDAVLA